MDENTSRQLQKAVSQLETNNRLLEDNHNLLIAILVLSFIGVVLAVVFYFILHSQNSSRTTNQEETNRMNTDLIIKVTQAISTQTEATKETNRLQAEIKEIFKATGGKIDEANGHYEEAISIIKENGNKIDKLIGA